MQRILQPELLDSLPPEHPDAVHNRRDLRITNLILGNHRWLARVLPNVLAPGDVALELGAGTGELALRLARSGFPVDALDVWPAPPAWPADRKWHQADLRTFRAYERYTVVLGNLIFHQFSDAELGALGETLRRNTRVLLACEPARRRISQRLYHWFGRLFGANHVSLHDAHVSIAAGFRDDELARALGLRAPEWNVTCHTSLLGVYRMIAVRNVATAPARRFRAAAAPHGGATFA